MINLKEILEHFVEEGYSDKNAEARVCQDIILMAIANSSLSHNVTIKGGVVMSSLTRNRRRATQDMDIDFIRYSIADESIDRFIGEINCVNGISIVRFGDIEELSQQEYNGKRVFVKISDDFGGFIESKIDLGVHKQLGIEQQEYCFDIAFDDEGASLLINSCEQMFTEKLRSLLKFGTLSTRYKDIYDMYYHCDKLDSKKLKKCLDTYIYGDLGMREDDIEDVIRRVKFVFGNNMFRSRVDKSDKRWLDENIDVIFKRIIDYLERQR